MTAAKKTAPPALDLPPRPPSKVEQGLAASEGVPAAERENSPEVLRERAIEAMVAAGLSREFAEASFELADNETGGTAADASTVAEAVSELTAWDFGAPYPTCGCHPAGGWTAVPAAQDGIGCEHGSWLRQPKGKTEK